MYHKSVLLFLLFFILSLRSFSAVFVVTSKADSGPGTLREALTKAAANDSTTTDYIRFNLPDLSETGRTIILYSQLPDVTSNLVIDGTTQPGNKFGISDAHVQLQYQVPVLHSLAGLSVANHHDVAIYGLYINLVTTTESFLFNGIALINDKNIIIGAAGKGNVINGFYSPLAANPSDDIHHETTTFPFENLTLQDNFFGIAPDGKTLSANQTVGVGLGFVLNQVIIGGTPAEGNLFPQGLYIGEQNSQDKIDTNPNDAYATESANILIQNNKIGVDYNVENGIPNSNGLNISTGDPNGHNTISILDNIISASNSYAIFPDNIGEKITILRNYIGTDKTLTKRFKTGGIFMYWDTGQVAIGSNDPADANFITNCNPVTVWPYTNATVNKNSFFCTVGQQPMHYNGYGEFNFPVIKILKTTATSVSGTATPDSKIELFYDDICKTCSPQTYFGSTTADANGKWTYNGPITGPVIASATDAHNTSDFSRTSIDESNVKIINTCNGGLGSITGIVVTGASQIQWEDQSGKPVGSDPDLLNVKPGKYKLVINNGSCGASTSFYEIKGTFSIDITGVKKTNPSCGNSNGSVSGVVVINNDAGQTNIAWKDVAGKTWGSAVKLENVPAGAYSLLISNADNSCTQTYGPIILENTTGPNINQASVKIQSTNCGQATGSITNISATGSGTLKYKWANDQQQQVGTDKDLLNQPAGTYKLQVTDDTQCGPIYTTDIVIPETNGVTLDESKVQTSVASCSQNNGSITGITFSGATKFQWVDANNKVVATTADFKNAVAGDYTFTASNNFGCSKTSKVYHVDLQAPVQFPPYAATIVPSCFGNNNGSVSVAIDGLAKSARWINGQGVTVWNGASLLNTAAGTYQLYLTDQNGCENYYNTYIVDELPEYKVAGTGEIVNDQCGLKIGSISNVNITGGVPPYIYKWTNANNGVVGETNSITNLAAGKYVLNVVDARCGNVDIPYTIIDESADVVAPSVSDLQLCSSGSALLIVNNAALSVTYRLYDAQSSAQPIDEQKGGKFNITVSANRSYFISQLTGTCESSRAEVKVAVGLSVVNIANTFTPNGDGVNDYWKITSIENYPDAIVQVFSRYGQKVYESKGYGTPFEGNLNGKKLPAGVYYYIINLKTNCNILSGSLTVIR